MLAVNDIILEVGTHSAHYCCCWEPQQVLQPVPGPVQYSQLNFILSFNLYHSLFLFQVYCILGEAFIHGSLRHSQNSYDLCLLIFFDSLLLFCWLGVGTSAPPSIVHRQKICCFFFVMINMNGCFEAASGMPFTCCWWWLRLCGGVYSISVGEAAPMLIRGKNLK